MSYHRYNYTSPSGAHSYSSSSYASPSGNSRYSSKSSYDSTRIGSGGLGSSKYGSGGYGDSLGSLSSSRYGDYGSSSKYGGSSYSPSSSYSGRSYSPSSSSYSKSRYDSPSSYTPRSDYSRYSRPTSGYDSKYRSSDLDSDYSRPARKTRFADEDDYGSSRPSRKAAEPDIAVKTPKSDSKARQRRREKDEGSSPAPAAPPAAAPEPDVSALTRKTQNLAVDPAPSQPSAPKPFTPDSTPLPPKGDNVATKGTSAMNQQAANPDSIPVCAKCATEIRGPFVLALNKSWCPTCFTCKQCNSELVNMGFVELNGSIYCENDYESFFAPKCAKCRQAIVGDTVNALDKTWHPACFVCQECGAAISSGAFHVEEGRPYCMKDWQRLFQTKCVGCGYPVEPGDKWIEALEANWHSECFVCGVCNAQLEGKPFYPRDGKPFCKDHAAR